MFARCLLVLAGLLSLQGCAPVDDSPEILVERARLFLDRGKADDAIEMLDRVIVAWPESADAFFDRASAHQRVGELEAALDDFNRALQLDPEGSRVLNDRGVLLARLGRFEEAIADFRRLLQLVPGDANGWMNLGLTQHKQDKLDEALAAYRRSTELQREAESMFLEASVLYELGKYEESASLLTDVLQDEPDWAKAWLNRGLCRLSMNQAELASEDFQQCREVDDQMQFAAALSELSRSNQYRSPPAVAKATK